MEQLHFIYNDGKKNIIGTAFSEESIAKAVPSSIGYYLYTESDAENIEGSPDTWELSGDYDGYGTGDTISEITDNTES